MEGMAEYFSMMAEEWRQLASYASDLAYSQMTLYQAYLAEGFSEDQAMELIKNI